MSKPINVCLGCWDEIPIRNCQRTDCFAHDQRKGVLVMDKELNDKLSAIAKRRTYDILMGGNLK